MAYQEVTKTSYGSRLGNSLKGILTGLVLLVAAIVLLWWNEGRAVKVSKMLKAAETECVDVASVDSVDPALEGKLIHATAVAKTDEVLTDPDYGLSVNAIRLERDVEYYQWVEHSSSETKDKIGGGQETTTTYTYSKEWVSGPVDSGSFKDPDYQGSNYVRTTVPENTVTAQKVDFGAYVLPQAMVGAIPAGTAVNVPDSVANGVDIFVQGNTVYYGENPQTPAVGDVRVSFSEADGGVASILGQVKGNTFESFKHKNGKSLMVLRMGEHSQEEMFESEKASNKFILWLVRILGIILMISALRMTFDILVAILKVLPFLGNIAQVGVNLVTGVVGFILSLVVIMIAWVAYRPLLAVVLALVIVALVCFLISKSKKAPAAADAAAPAGQQS
ncbi:MAG: TMEM43 family protein [Bacteroidales bacterium]|nr:TMEM43 family protein [Bacteroidales bacterium]MBR6876402.1 TMEM43 family protein [Bacteroidales bacterium]